VARVGLALALAWLGGGWLVAGAAREARLPVLPVLFHVVAALAALGLLVALRRLLRLSAEQRGLAAFRGLAPEDLIEAGGIAAQLGGEVGVATRRMIEGVGSRVERLQDSSLRVAGAADGVERSAAGLAAGASQQAAAAGEVTAAMEELARTAAEIADHAERQSGYAARAETEGSAGAAAVAEAVDGVGEVQARIADVTQRADNLGTRSREIFRVLELISEIAQETHLLSLNAALEATGAGDRGRRFGVVAEEVRVLAERVRDSVASVRSQVEEFASAIRSTVVATEEGTKEAARVLDEARAATAALESLRAALAESSEASRQISSVTRQQTSATEEVLSTLRDLHQVVERMSRDLGHLSSTAGRLREVGLDLQLLAQTFRTDSPRSLKRLADRWLDRLASLSGEEAMRALGELMAESRFVEAGWVVGADGKLAAIRVAERFRERESAALAELRKLDLRGRPWFRAALESDRAVVIPPHTSLLSNEPCLTVAIGYAPPGGGRGVLGLDVNVHNWSEIGS